MDNSDSDQEFQEAAAIVKTVEELQASKSEKLINAAGDKVTRAIEHPIVGAGNSATGKAIIKVLNDQARDFVRNSTALLSLLDEVAKVHPFVQAAIIPFRAVIELEINRRENDARVVALITTMSDMMRTLTLLKRINATTATEGLIEESLRGEMAAIKESIKTCGSLCHGYMKRHVTVKFFSSWKWKPDFEEAAASFEEHKKAIQHVLLLHISIGVNETNNTLQSMQEDVLLVKAAFEHVLSPAEVDLSSFVEGKGGREEVLKDDRSLQKMLDKQKPSKDVKKSAKPESEYLDLTVSDFKEEVGREVKDVLLEYQSIFERGFKARFEMIESSFLDLKGTVKDEGERVIRVVKENMTGAHQRITNKELRKVWKEMGWKGSVKAKHLVLALHDHFAERATKTSSWSQAKATPPPDDTIAGDDDECDDKDDIWALQYLTIHRIQPVVEALDEDGSSFVTVNELNAFISARPKGWSLVRWLAYWAYGFEMTCRWYYLRIRVSLASLVRFSKFVLPENLSVVGKFLGSWPLTWTGMLLSGIQGRDSWRTADTWVNEDAYSKFQDFIVENEKSFKTILRKISYYIDEDTTLVTVTGGGRPEKYLLPVLHLLLQRALWIVDQGKRVVLDEEELDVISDSIRTLESAVDDRVYKLRAFYTIHNQDPDEKIRRVYLGLWSYVLEQPKEGVQFIRSFDWDHFSFDDELVNDPTVPEPGLFFSERMPRNLSSGLYSTALLASPNPLSESPFGYWSGVALGARSDMGILINIRASPRNPEGKIEGFGSDESGMFSISGNVVKEGIQFTAHPIASQPDEQGDFQYVGIVNADLCEIAGSWGPVQTLRQDEKATNAHGEGSQQTDDLESVGETEHNHQAPVELVDSTQSQAPSVMLYRRPDDFHCEPSKEITSVDKVKALWLFIHHIARFGYRTASLPAGDDLVERQEEHERWESIFEHQKMLTTEKQILAAMSSCLHPDDNRWWRDLYTPELRQEAIREYSVIHKDIMCDVCFSSPSTRLCCSICSEGQYLGTLDFCEDCGFKNERYEYKKHQHDLSHNLLQLRRVFPVPGLISLLSDTSSLLSYATNSADCSCYSCGEQLVQKPFWYCVECLDDVFVCMNCNKTHETQKPWLFEQIVEGDSAHFHIHTLLLVTEPAKALRKESVDHRLEILEKKFQEQGEQFRQFKESVDQRFESLDQFLRSVLQPAVTREITDAPVESSSE